MTNGGGSPIHAQSTKKKKAQRKASKPKTPKEQAAKAKRWRGMMPPSL